MPMIPPQPQRAGRNCGNCACFYELPHPQNPGQKQGFCALKPPIAGQVRVQVPRLDKQGKPVTTPRGPAMDAAEDIAFAHAPTAASLCCIEGWRPIGTLPGERGGERGIDVRMRELARAAQPALEQLVSAGVVAPELAALVMTAMGAAAPAAANDPAPPAAPASELDS